MAKLLIYVFWSWAKISHSKTKSNFNEVKKKKTETKIILTKKVPFFSSIYFSMSTQIGSDSIKPCATIWDQRQILTCLKLTAALVRELRQQFQINHEFTAELLSKWFILTVILVLQSIHCIWRRKITSNWFDSTVNMKLNATIFTLHTFKHAMWCHRIKPNSTTCWWFE